MAKILTARIGILIASSGEWYAIGYPQKDGADPCQIAIEAVDIGMSEDWPADVRSYLVDVIVPIPEQGEELPAEPKLLRRDSVESIGVDIRELTEDGTAHIDELIRQARYKLEYLERLKAFSVAENRYLDEAIKPPSVALTTIPAALDPHESDAVETATPNVLEGEKVALDPHPERVSVATVTDTLTASRSVSVTKRVCARCGTEIGEGGTLCQGCDRRHQPKPKAEPTNGKQTKQERRRLKLRAEGRCQACGNFLGDGRQGKNLCCVCQDKNTALRSARRRNGSPAKSEEPPGEITQPRAEEPNDLPPEVVEERPGETVLPRADHDEPTPRATEPAVLESRVVDRLAEEIREYLYEHERGATVFDIVRTIGCERKHAANALHDMPDVLHESGLWRLTTIPART